MAFPWTALPPDLLEGLMAGSTGKAHLTRCARAALAPETRAADLGLHLLASAWENDPLDSRLASQVLALDDKLRLAPEPLRTLLAQAAKADALLARLRPAVDRALGDGSAEDLTRAAADVRAVFPAGGDMLMARGHCLAGRFERAAALCVALEGQTPLASMRNLHARCALALGDRKAAMDLLRASLALHPWQVSPLLVLADLAFNADMASVMPQGEVALLLYTWNKARDLDAALASLAASDTGGARILALDNGSSDDTPDVLRAWAGRLGEQLVPVTLPCNIGAPAARNWLMTLPQMRAARWAAFLDDDVELPSDWLARLGAAAETYPEASVWGCKVVDREAPAVVQNVDLHLRGPWDSQAAPGGGKFRPAFEMTDLHLEGTDMGQFAYMRPCASVTGCCHLFRTDRLLASGEFDIRFSPTQFDDLEHDLRMLGAGGGAVYTGHLTVRHARRTGADTAANAQAGGNALGNRIKLFHKIGPEQAAEMRKAAARRALDDVLSKERALGL